MFDDDILIPVRLTVELATLTTLILLAVGTPLAWWLARSPARWKEVVATLVALPLVLPPTVLGFYLLVALGPSGLGGLLGLRTLAFSFEGLVIGSVIYSLPFVVQPIRNAFEAIGERPFEVAATLRASPLDRFVTIALPLALPGFLTGAVLGFAHTVGEFGVVLMIGGSIPGETKVLSVAIYDYVETLRWTEANILAGGMVVFLLPGHPRRHAGRTPPRPDRRRAGRRVIANVVSHDRSTEGGVSVALAGRLGAFALDVAFDAPPTGVSALFGPSGSGKTSVLARRRRSVAAGRPGVGRRRDLAGRQRVLPAA